MIDLTGLESFVLDDVPVLTRRRLVAFLCASLVFPFAPQAFGGSKTTGEKEGGDEGSAGEHDDTDTGGKDNTGSSEGIGSQRERHEGNDQETAREAVAEGHVLPLKDVLNLIDQDRYGTVIAIDLERYRGNDIYRLKTRDGSGVIRDLRIDARTGRFLNILGF